MCKILLDDIKKRNIQTIKYYISIDKILFHLIICGENKKLLLKKKKAKERDFAEGKLLPKLVHLAEGRAAP